MTHTFIFPVISVVSIIVTALLFGFLWLFIFIRKKRENKKLLNPEQEEKQDAKNREYVNRIIVGNYTYVLPHAAEAGKAFEKWQAFQKKMFREASKDRLKLRNRYIDENKFREFAPDVTDDLSKNALPHGSVLFIENAFTEPFPSLHDMDDWAIDTQIADIMILNGITPEESRNFCVYIKNYFVNHEMIRGIIQFDVYKLAA